ncbi:ABC transporter substrate-binding protein [uncultured Agrococcus sp.]|uniref:ABC transporter substrate-binding protein n=1 Tax=uncultured Agrococcus sp. TaxID=382258 RepID=UPI0025F402E4|nr:ABC transporter substrate-binding protein [uncultured Agrococcus sp.]
MSGMERRTFLKGLGLAAAIPLFGASLASCSAASRNRGSNGDADSIVVVDSGGEYSDAAKQAFYDPFTEATGIRVQPTPYESTGTLMRQLAQSPGNYDVLSNAPLGAVTMQAEGLLAPIDYSLLGQFSDMNDLPEDGRGEFHVDSNYWASVMAYRTDVFDGSLVPQTWQDFWDADTFQGPRSMQSDISPIEYEFALIADGVAADPKELYPIDIDRALQSLDGIAPHISTFWASGALSTQALAQREVVLTTIWNGRAQGLIDEGAPVAISWNGAMRRSNAWMIPNGSEKVEAAHQFIDFTANPERQAEFAQLTGYGPTNETAYDFIDEETAIKLPSNPDWVDEGFAFNSEWWAENEAQANEAWSRWATQ